MKLRDRILGILRHNTNLDSYERKRLAALILIAVELDNKESQP